MNYLTEQSREIYDKLVRLAGGRREVVFSCLTRKRRYVLLRDLIEEIVAAKSSR